MFENLFENLLKNLLHDGKKLSSWIIEQAQTFTNLQTQQKFQTQFRKLREFIYEFT